MWDSHINTAVLLVGRGNALPTAYCWAPTRELALHLAFDMCDHIWASGRLYEAQLSPLLQVREPSFTEITNGLYQDSNTHLSDMCFLHNVPSCPRRSLITRVPRFPVFQLFHKLVLILDARSKEPFPSTSEEQETLSIVENSFPCMILLSGQSLDFIQHQSPLQGQPFSWAPFGPGSADHTAWVSSLSLHETAPTWDMPYMRQHLRYNKAHGVCVKKMFPGFQVPQRETFTVILRD